jgi:hypothetical protein
MTLQIRVSFKNVPLDVFGVLFSSESRRPGIKIVKKILFLIYNK